MFWSYDTGAGAVKIPPEGGKSQIVPTTPGLAGKRLCLELVLFGEPEAGKCPGLRGNTKH